MNDSAQLLQHVAKHARLHKADGICAFVALGAGRLGLFLELGGFRVQYAVVFFKHRHGISSKLIR